MNRTIVFAGLLTFATFWLHVIGGGIEVHHPMLSSGMDHKLKAFASILWHFVSAVLLINSGALLFAAWQPSWRDPLVWSVIAQHTAIAVLFVFYGITRLGEIWSMPQWVIFLVINAICLTGLRRQVLAATN